MAKFLVTMLPANDLGLPTRMIPVARALADRGHDVAHLQAKSESRKWCRDDSRYEFLAPCSRKPRLPRARN